MAGERIIVIDESSSPASAKARGLPSGATTSNLLHAHMELGKVRLSAMVVFTTALGFVVASKFLPPDQFDWLKLLWTCLGTFLAAVGAGAFNQAIETRYDARMHRTRNRPLVTGALSRTYAATFGLIVSICGVAILCPTSNGLTAMLASANVLLYVGIYTPLKRVTTLNTLVGAIVGALPPMMGWTAVTDTLIGPFGWGAWILGGTLFVWQIPHFLALSWMYREDYQRGGFVMLPSRDRRGVLTGMAAVIYAAMLLPLCLLLVYLGHAGIGFALVALVLTGGLVACAMRFAQRRGEKDARRLFFASIIYLPLLAITLMIWASGPFDGMTQGRGGYSTPSNEKFIDPGQAR